MKRILALSVTITALFMAGCGVNRQLAEVKTLGDCRYSVAAADSIYIAGYSIDRFRDIKRVEDFNPLKYPRIAAGLLTRSIPLDARIVLDITNPTNRVAGINQFEYRILMAGKELAQGFVNQRVEVQPGGGRAQVPIRVGTNAYSLMNDDRTRDTFMDFVRALSGDNTARSARLTIKVKPMLTLGGRAINYPGYITIDKDVSSQLLRGR